jgi:hypothetical protein
MDARAAPAQLALGEEALAAATAALYIFTVACNLALLAGLLVTSVAAWVDAQGPALPDGRPQREMPRPRAERWAEERHCREA